MKTRRKTVLGAALALAGWLAAGQARAANPAYLNIDVTIVSNLSVAVNGAATSTYTATWSASNPNAKLVAMSTSTALVSNDSGGQTEKWSLSTNASSINYGGPGTDTWARAASSDTVGDDQFAVQAVFASSTSATCPTGASAVWDAVTVPPLTTSPANYTSTRFVDASLSNANGTTNPEYTAPAGADGRMKAGSQRSLCWRIITPSTTATLDPQNVQIIVTAANP